MQMQKQASREFRLNNNVKIKANDTQTVRTQLLHCVCHCDYCLTQHST